METGSRKERLRVVVVGRSVVELAGGTKVLGGVVEEDGRSSSVAP